MRQNKKNFGVVRLSTKGQMVIPEDIRTALGLREGDYLAVKARSSMRTGWVIELTKVYAPGESK